MSLPEAKKPDFFNDIEFEFKILSIKKTNLQNQNDVITSITWQVIGKYNNIIEQHTCERQFLQMELENQETFIDYNSLTEDIVKSWIMDDELLDNIKSSVANKIDSQLEPQEEIKEFPWSVTANKDPIVDAIAAAT